MVRGELDVHKIAEVIKKILQNSNFNGSVIVTVKDREQGNKSSKE